jgi:hypothetical protein
MKVSELIQTLSTLDPDAVVGIETEDILFTLAEDVRVRDIGRVKVVSEPEDTPMTEVFVVTVGGDAPVAVLEVLTAKTHKELVEYYEASGYRATSVTLPLSQGEIEAEMQRQRQLAEEADCDCWANKKQAELEQQLAQG